MFSYTSGTTGEPKGAMISNFNLGAFLYAAEEWIDFNCYDRHISYLPLAHIFERAASLVCLQKCASIFIYNGDMLKIKEDLQIAQPTIFLSAPRLYNKFYEAMKKSIKE